MRIHIYFSINENYNYNADANYYYIVKATRGMNFHSHLVGIKCCCKRIIITQ